MATRFYLSSTAVAPVSPAFFGTWTRTTEGDRYTMSPTKDGSAMTDKSAWANGSAGNGDSALIRQYVSDPMTAGIGFTTGDTFKAQIRAQEADTGDNITQTQIGIKVYSEDGTTLQATLKAQGHYATTSGEWATSLRNTEFHDPASDNMTTGYTTVAGDRLVIEVGGRTGAAGTTVTATMSFGSDSGTDLPEDQTTTTPDNPWFEISRDITFAAASNKGAAMHYYRMRRMA